VHFQLVLIELF